ncbi:hypothetical protein [Asanoa sp. NPDC050611]|uniref:hypothetical protein n=1 Tax=Asanoa sp. NPDC050611 TaxID=3157098 RepID=UPI0033E4E29C
MGIFSKKDDWRPPRPPDCACREHLDDVLTEIVPNRDWDEDPTVAELLDTGSLGVKPMARGERFAAPVDEERNESTVGPLHWVLWAADEIYGCYDDDAELPVDRSIANQPGVDVVEWFDREEFWIGAPDLCESGLLAAVARALQDPRVRVRRNG